MRIPIILAFVALALAGCNANQAINPSGHANLCASDPSCDDGQQDYGDCGCEPAPPFEAGPTQ